jgi:hypothetical protein
VLGVPRDVLVLRLTVQDSGSCFKTLNKLFALYFNLSSVKWGAVTVTADRGHQAPRVGPALFICCRLPSRQNYTNS